MFVIDRLIDWLIVYRQFDWLIEWLIVYRLFDCLIDWLIDRLSIVCSIDWLIDYLLCWIHFGVVKFTFFSVFFPGRAVLYRKPDSGGASGESDPCPAQVQENVTSPGRWASEFGWCFSSFFWFQIINLFLILQLMLDKAVPLCSWQYYRTFDTCRVPGIETGMSNPFFSPHLLRFFLFFIFFFCDFFQKTFFPFFQTRWCISTTALTLSFYTRAGSTRCRRTARVASWIPKSWNCKGGGTSSFFFFAVICPPLFSSSLHFFLLLSTFFLFSRQYERILQDTSAPQPGEDLLAALTAGKGECPRCNCRDVFWIELCDLTVFFPTLESPGRKFAIYTLLAEWIDFRWRPLNGYVFFTSYGSMQCNLSCLILGCVLCGSGRRGVLLRRGRVPLRGHPKMTSARDKGKGVGKHWRFNIGERGLKPTAWDRCGQAGVRPPNIGCWRHFLATLTIFILLSYIINYYFEIVLFFNQLISKF